MFSPASDAWPQVESQAGLACLYGDEAQHEETDKEAAADARPGPLDVPAEINNSWSFDFMSDTLYSGMRFRALNIIDEGVREALDIVVDTSITAGRVVRVLNLLKSQRGVRKSMRVDNGPEMTAQAFADWCKENDVRID